MKLTKRILAMFMAMLMLFSGMAISANAAVIIADYELNTSAKTLEIKKLAEAETWSISFTTSPSTVAAPTLLTETDEAFFYCNLEYGTTYTTQVSAFIGGEIVSQTLNIKLLRQAAAPSAPVPKNRTSTTIEIASVSGCEYRIDGGAWGSKTLFDNLTPGTSHTIEMRVKETATTYASAPSQVIIKTLNLAQKGIAPKPVFVDKTKTTITVQEVTGVEFSIDNGAHWQESGLFTGLSADKTYPIIARYTFDETEYEPNPASLPLEIKTNSRDSYPAELKNCKFIAPEGVNYANQPIAISVTADTPAKYHDTQYGDTKYIPAYYTVGTSTTPLYFTSSDGKVFKGSFTPGDANANKEKLAVNVYYNKMKCIGEDPATNEAKWIVVGEEETKTYYVQVGESYTFFTRFKDFFLEIFNFFFNTLPAKINDMLAGVDLPGIFEELAGLTDLLGMLTGNGSGGTGGGLGDIGDLLGGLTGGETA